MAKRKNEQPEEGSPAWMSTFSDLMNLLLCFFVLLFASSTVDEGKIQKIAASFQNLSFSIIPEGTINLIQGQMISGGVTQLKEIDSILDLVGKASEATGNNVEIQAGSTQDSDSSESSDAESTTEENFENQDFMAQYQQEGMNQSEEMYEEITDMVESYSIEDRVSIDYNYEYVELDMNGAILFDTGEAELKDDSKFFMQKIANILSKYKDCIIEIEGHTDNVPIHNSHYESNRYLSTARATKVYEYIMENQNLTDENIKVAGYGESRPIASNDTVEGRAKNRRVVIKIYNPLSSE